MEKVYRFNLCLNWKMVVMYEVADSMEEAKKSLLEKLSLPQDTCLTMSTHGGIDKEWWRQEAPEKAWF